jgi:hypothetical protein
MKMINLLREVVLAYDEFMLSDMDTHITNPSWLRLTEAIHRVRIYFREQRNEIVAGGKRNG